LQGVCRLPFLNPLAKAARGESPAPKPAAPLPPAHLEAHAHKLVELAHHIHRAWRGLVLWGVWFWGAGLAAFVGLGRKAGRLELQDRIATAVAGTHAGLWSARGARWRCRVAARVLAPARPPLLKLRVMVIWSFPR
jgi:hypothetical protein